MGVRMKVDTSIKKCQAYMGMSSRRKRKRLSGPHDRQLWRLNIFIVIDCIVGKSRIGESLDHHRRQKASSHCGG